MPIVNGFWIPLHLNVSAAERSSLFLQFLVENATPVFMPCLNQNCNKKDIAHFIEI